MPATHPCQSGTGISPPLPLVLLTRTTRGQACSTSLCCSPTPPVSRGPQPPRPGTTTKPALWAVSSTGMFGAVRHFGARQWAGTTEPLQLVKDDCPIKSSGFFGGQFVHARLLRASHTRRVVWL